MKYKKLGKICIKCGKRFEPTGSFCRICESCIDLSYKNRIVNSMITKRRNKLLICQK